MCGHMTATDSPAADPSTNGGSQRRGFGVDVGGSGVKGGIVDLDTGQLIGERFKLATPQPATPDAVSKTVAAVVREFGWTDKVGVTYPGVVTDGIVRTAANVDKGWIGINASEFFGKELDGQQVTVLNDADAAGLAEEKFGAGRDNTGVIVLLTFGTGIGSAVIHNGVLLPNTEFGHLEVGGKEAEHRAASSVKENKDWSYERWTKEVTKVLDGRRERDLARPVHRGRRNQPQGRQMGPAAEEPHPRRRRRPAEHRRNRRSGDGRRRGRHGYCQVATPERLTSKFAARGGVIRHCRYNGRRRPPNRTAASIPADINATFDIADAFRWCMPHAHRNPHDRKGDVAATKASPAAAKPVKRTATKTPAKKASAAKTTNGSAPAKPAKRATKAAARATKADKPPAAKSRAAAKPAKSRGRQAGRRDARQGRRQDRRRRPA